MLLILVFTLTDAKANDTSLVKKQNIGISKIGANSKKRMSFSDSAIQIPQKQFQYLCSQKVFVDQLIILHKLGKIGDPSKVVQSVN